MAYFFVLFNTEIQTNAYTVSYVKVVTVKNYNAGNVYFISVFIRNIFNGNHQNNVTFESYNLPEKMPIALGIKNVTRKIDDVYQELAGTLIDFIQNRKFRVMFYHLM